MIPNRYIIMCVLRFSALSFFFGKAEMLDCRYVEGNLIFLLFCADNDDDEHRVGKKIGAKNFAIRKKESSRHGINDNLKFIGNFGEAWKPELF